MMSSDKALRKLIHDMNTPLSIINMAAEQILRNQSNLKLTEENAHKILQNCRKMIDLMQANDGALAQQEAKDNEPK